MHLSINPATLQAQREGINHRSCYRRLVMANDNENSICKVCGKKIIFNKPASLGSVAGVFTYKTLAMTRTMRLVRSSQPNPYDAIPEVKYVRDEKEMSPVNASASSRRGVPGLVKRLSHGFLRIGIRPFPTKHSVPNTGTRVPCPFLNPRLARYEKESASTQVRQTPSSRIKKTPSKERCKGLPSTAVAVSVHCTVDIVPTLTLNTKLPLPCTTMMHSSM